MGSVSSARGGALADEGLTKMSAEESALQAQVAALQAQLAAMQTKATEASEEAKRHEEAARAAEAARDKLLEANDSGELMEELATLRKQNAIAAQDIRTRDELEEEVKARRKENEELKGRSVMSIRNKFDTGKSEDPEALERELLQLRSENRDLRLKGGVGLTKDDDELILEEFLSRMSAVLAMRHAGEYKAELFESYQESLVQLTDDAMREMYLNLMLIYMGDYNDEVLARCNIPEVTEEVLGFCEMQTMRMGQLLDQPRNMRIQGLKNEKAKKSQLFAKGERKKEDEVRPPPAHSPPPLPAAPNSPALRPQARRTQLIEKYNRANAKALDDFLPTAHRRARPRL